MFPFVVVIIYVSRATILQRYPVFRYLDINFFVFEGPEEPIDESVIGGYALAVHIYFYPLVF